MQQNTFGSTLREYRHQSGLSQRELALKIGVDFSYISKLENDRLPPPAADTILQICSALEIEPEGLLALTGKIPSEIQEKVGSNQTAQEFLRKAQQMDLTDDEWTHMIQSLRQLRDQSNDG
jgi:HTH-type transcriptional regulator, competence development regulator